MPTITADSDYNSTVIPITLFFPLISRLCFFLSSPCSLCLPSPLSPASPSHPYHPSPPSPLFFVTPPLASLFPHHHDLLPPLPLTSPTSPTLPSLPLQPLPSPPLLSPVRLISTKPVQQQGRTLTRVLIGDAQPKMRMVAPRRAAP